jgi:hypothetical protein
MHGQMGWLGLSCDLQLLLLKSVLRSSNWLLLANRIDFELLAIDVSSEFLNFCLTYRALALVTCLSNAQSTLNDSQCLCHAPLATFDLCKQFFGLIGKT